MVNNKKYKVRSFNSEPLSKTSVAQLQQQKMTQMNFLKNQRQSKDKSISRSDVEDEGAVTSDDFNAVKRRTDNLNLLTKRKTNNCSSKYVFSSVCSVNRSPSISNSKFSNNIATATTSQNEGTRNVKTGLKQTKRHCQQPGIHEQDVEDNLTPYLDSASGCILDKLSPFATAKTHSHSGFISSGEYNPLMRTALTEKIKWRKMFANGGFKPLEIRGLPTKGEARLLQSNTWKPYEISSPRYTKYSKYINAMFKTVPLTNFKPLVLGDCLTSKKLQTREDVLFQQYKKFGQRLKPLSSVSRYVKYPRGIISFPLILSPPPGRPVTRVDNNTYQENWSRRFSLPPEKDGDGDESV